MENSLFSVAQVASRLGIAQITVRRLITAQKIPHHRIGGRYLFNDDDLASFLESTQVPAKGAKNE